MSLGLRARLLIAMFLIISVSLALVSGQAVLLFQEDKSSYVFDLNASRAIKIADEIQANVRHLTEKMRIFSEAVRLPLPEGVDRRPLLASMLRQYPEFLLCSTREGDGPLRNVFLSAALSGIGALSTALTVAGGATQCANPTELRRRLVDRDALSRPARWSRLRWPDRRRRW